LVEIGSVASEEKVFQLQPSLGGIVLGGPPSKIVSGDPNFHQDGHQVENRKRG
jgi:hypothetical protein